MTDPPELTPFLVAMPGDIVIGRSDRQYVVRCTKRYQEFAPRPMFDSLNPFDILFGILFAGLRKIPAMITNHWQSGVLQVGLTKAERPKVLAKQKFRTRDEAEAYQRDLERQVRNGAFADSP